MEQRKSIIHFSDLINGDYAEIISSYLSLKDVLKLRSTSRDIKEAVSKYMFTNRSTFLVLPPDITYNPPTIVTLQHNIVDACSYFGKEPPQCNMTLNCTVSSKLFVPKSIEINPPLNALREIGRTGVKTELNILDSRVTTDFFKENGGVEILKQIIECLPHTQSIYIRFLADDSRVGWVAGTWFYKTTKALNNLQELSSLRISGDSPWKRILTFLPDLTHLKKLRVTCNKNLDGVKLLETLSQMKNLTSLSISTIRTNANELTACLSHIPELQSLRLSRVEIEAIDDYKELGKNLETALPNLRELALRKVSVDNEDEEEDERIEALLPHIRKLLSQLTSLDLSKNSISRLDDGEGNGIVPAMTGYMSKLTSLNLSDNFIGQDDTHLIIPLLESLTKLEELNLALNHINSDFIRVLIPTLQKLPLLIKLNLSYNYLNSQAIDDIQELLCDESRLHNNACLKLLDVSGNYTRAGPDDYDESQSDDDESQTDMEALN